MSSKKRRREKNLVVRKYEGAHTKLVLCVAAMKDRVFTGSNDSTVVMYERKGEGKQIGTFKGHQGPVYCMRITQDRKGLITGSYDKTIIHWTISNQEEVRTFRGHTSGVLSVDTYGDLLVSGGDDKILILWSISKGDRLRDIRGHTNCVSCVQFSSDGKSVFSGSYDKTVIRWKVSDGAQIMKYEGGHRGGVTSLAVTRDDSKLITGSYDHTCIIWNVLSGARLNIFGGHNGGVWSFALSPCERYFASGSYDKTTILWDIAKGKQVHVLADHDQHVLDVTFYGRRSLFTAASDGTAIEYDINSLLKDIPARLEFLLSISRLHATAESAKSSSSCARTRHQHSFQKTVNFAA